MRKPLDLSLYLVTDRGLSLGRPLEDVVAQAVAGGVTIVQLREKDAPTGEFVSLAKKLMHLLKPLNIPLIINDRVDVALAADADGVHIGQSDMAYQDVRKLIGYDKIIGLSVENMHDLEIANSLDVDYVGISPVFGTPTKTDTAQPFGLQGLKDAVRLSIHPTVGIGGMNANTAKDVMQTGCNGIAVVSAICSAQDPTQAAKELKALVDANATTLWSQHVWRTTYPIYQAILKQKFINELAAGTLALDKFASYIGQDELYLKNYYPCMFQLAEMMDTPQNQALFTSIAKSGMEGEKIMHNFLIEKYGINTDVPFSDVTTTYNNLIKNAVDSKNSHIAFACMLPCMWIYNRVGLHILKTAQLENNPYKEWITEYGNEAFTHGVNAVLDIIDTWAAQTDQDTRCAMTNIYTQAALCEYAFWEYGYEGELKNYDYLHNPQAPKPF
ncbi:MAG: thiamine phosphate synthase [Paludibacteraceae bacterium]|nr:thiamine phosphate synthase [Paludibacteraceae bacterium]